MLTNNIRDIDTDRVAGKRTLAVRLGSQRARVLYMVCITGAIGAVVASAAYAPWALLGLIAAPLAFAPARLVLGHSDPPSLVKALLGTARFQLVLCTLLAVGLWAS
jgi:1,4-dihydroxy-2-naphthoate octaprenyltransferase